MDDESQLVAYEAAARDIPLPLAPENVAVYALIGTTYRMKRQYNNSTTHLNNVVTEDSTYHDDWLDSAYCHSCRKKAGTTDDCERVGAEPDVLFQE